MAHQLFSKARGGLIAAAMCTMGLGAIVSTPAYAATFVSGTQMCAGGPSHFAGVSATVSGRASSLVFTQVSNPNNQIGDTFDGDGSYKSWYSPWTAANWSLAGESITRVSGICG